MSDSIYSDIQGRCKYLGLDFTAEEMGRLADEYGISECGIEAVGRTLDYIAGKKRDSIVSTLLRMSRLPVKEPKTFENFDFTQLHGPDTGALASLSTLSALYAHRNLAFIGPQGVGKTHLAMAFGRACCEKGFKTYFLKATELNQKLMDALRYGHENSTTNSLVKPSCLIVDEIGHCVFNKDCTRLFFDIIDRRYNKEGPNTMIFTSNVEASTWCEYFDEDSSLLCAVDRIFDNATVFMIKGDSYRGRKRTVVPLSAGISVTKKQ